MPFIREVRVAEPGTSSEHVTDVRFSAVTTGALRTASREAVHDAIKRGARFRTFDERTHNQADVIARVSPRGTRYITTVADGQETNNLLRLPRF